MESCRGGILFHDIGFLSIFDYMKVQINPQQYVEFDSDYMTISQSGEQMKIHKTHITGVGVKGLKYWKHFRTYFGCSVFLNLFIPYSTYLIQEVKYDIQSGMEYKPLAPTMFMLIVFTIWSIFMFILYQNSIIENRLYMEGKGELTFRINHDKLSTDELLFNKDANELNRKLTLTGEHKIITELNAEYLKFRFF